MKYTLTKPCHNCPFLRKGGIPLHADRIEEIATTNGEFPCHATTVSTDDGEGGRKCTKNSLHCAGSLVYRELSQTPSQMMRIAERLGLYDARALMADTNVTDLVCDSMDELLEVHERANDRTHKHA